MQSKNEIIIRKSERIIDKNKLVMESFCYTLQKYIDLIKCEYYFINQMNIFTNMYQYILDNLNIILKFTYYTNFVNPVVKRGIEKLSDYDVYVKSQEYKYRMKQLIHIQKKLIHIFSRIETKYIEHFFPRNRIIVTTPTDDDMCPICLENIPKNKVIVTNCNHCFHTKCLFMHIIERNSCPICRDILKKIDNIVAPN